MEERYRLSGLELNGFGDGDMGIFVVENGRAFLTRLGIPADWETAEAAGEPYVLGVIASRPAWRRATNTVIGTGFGNNYGFNYGGDAP